MAEEIGTLPNEINTTSTVDLALMIEDKSNDPPEFNQDRYSNISYFRSTYSVDFLFLFEIFFCLSDT